MNVIAFSKSASLTMSSKEIAELVGKEHKNVIRDIRVMIDELGDGSELSHVQEAKDARGYTTEFRLPKDLTLTLVTGYDVKRRHAINVRWLQLEEQVAAPAAPALPDFTNPALAARAWAEQFEARIAAEAKKAEIGSRREATAMNTASLAVKKANKLAIELDKSMQYATVKRMEMLYHGQSFNWRLLKSTATQMNMPPIDVFDANYGTVKAYHADVWREAYALEIITESMEKTA
jgi:hypothetical protein